MEHTDKSQLDNPASEIDVPPQYQPQPEQPAQPVGSANSPQAIDAQWQTKQDYKAAKQPKEFKQAPEGVRRVFANIAIISGIIFGISVLVFVLSFSTPIGQIGSFTGTQSRATTAYPVVGISVLVASISYFVAVIANIVGARKKQSRGLSLVGLILGIVLVANPVGLLVLSFIVMCNLQSCSGS